MNRTSAPKKAGSPAGFPPFLLLSLVLANQILNGLNAHLDGGVEVVALGLVQSGGLTLLIPDHMEAGTTTPAVKRSADSISEAKTPRRFQASHLANSS